MNNLFSALLVFGTALLGYIVFEGGYKYEVALLALIVCGVGILAWNFFKRKITPAIVMFAIINVIIGLILLYQYATLVIY